MACLGAGGGWHRAGWEKSLDLLGPLHVVRPRLLAGQALDEVFQAPPETYPLEWVVEPACTETAGLSAEGVRGEGHRTGTHYKNLEVGASH